MITTGPATLWFSLRRRLLGLLLGGVSICWAATLLFSYVDAHHEIDELFDAQLAQAGQVLLALASGEEAEVAELGDIAHKYQRRLRFQIWRADGQLLLRSNQAPQTPLTQRDGFSEEEGAHGHWRYFAQWNGDRSLQVQVSEEHRIRDELIGHIAWRLLLPALFGLPLLGAWVWLGTRKGLSALDGVAAQIADRAPQQLQAVTPATAPEEIRPMLEALNKLLFRMDQALEAERRFTADAAHELRTPLAALQAQLQVAQRARDSAEQQRSFAHLQAGLGRAAHLVEQMLQLARLDPEEGLPRPETLALAEVAEAVCADLGSAILDRELDFELEADPAARVRGQREWLWVLLRNLVDNALRYTPVGGRLLVQITASPAGARLAVSDSGPGIAPEDRPAVLRRFHRLNPGETPGSGLGLSIVARIVELHGAQLSLADGLGAPGAGQGSGSASEGATPGLTVLVQFPPPLASPPGLA